MTSPVVMGLPQSSTTCTATWPGNPADAEKPEEICVKTGTSVLGVQPFTDLGAREFGRFR